MTTWFSVLLILSGILIGAAIWAVALKLRRFQPILRFIAFFGPFILVIMFIYSLSVIKNADYPYMILTTLAIAYSIALIIMGILTVGVLIILAVGCYWLGVTLKYAKYRTLWRRFRRDFSYGWSRVRAWLEGEE